MVRRCRLGVMVPSSNVTMEYELYKMAPEGVTIHFTRIPQTEDTEEQLVAMINYVPQAAQLLAHARVDAIAFGCTSGSFIKGTGYDREIIKRIEENTGVPATTTTTAVLEALKLMEMRKISVGAPYTDPIMQKLKKLLEDNGFKVIKMKGLGLIKGEGDLPLDVTYKLAREIDSPESDGIFISCTDFKTVEILEILEEDLGKPVVSSNQATMWKLLRLAGLKTKIRGFGTLLREF